VRNLGVRQADAEIVFESVVIIPELECVSWHYSAPADCERIEAHPLCAGRHGSQLNPYGLSFDPQAEFTEAHTLSQPVLLKSA
jgi:hypothetical protein